MTWLSFLAPSFLSAFQTAFLFLSILPIPLSLTPLLSFVHDGRRDRRMLVYE